MEKQFVEPKNKAVFTAGIQYGTDTIRKLAEMQYNTFNLGRKLGQFAIGMVLIITGVFIGSTAAILALFLGCVVIMSLNLRPKTLADQIIKQYNGSYPTLRYSFTHVGLRTQLVPEEVSYKSAVYLIDDGKYLYIFLKDQSGYMVDRDTVKGSGGADALKELVARKTGLTWRRPFSLFNLRIKDIKSAMALSGSGGGGTILDSGERLDDHRR